MPPSALATPEQAPAPREPLEHVDLWRSVQNALRVLPSRFESDLVISGILATDLFAFNSALGATIEEQVVASLNKNRSVWDPDAQYALYSFERQSQTFPDVILKSASPDVEPRIILGIELKGWYVLASEREPSFRYKVTPMVCAAPDLLVVIPWALSNVISGRPRVFEPFILQARYAAELRNQHWREKSGPDSVTLSKFIGHYPKKADLISDVANSDNGGNFGRLARSNIMNDYMKELFDEKIAGISIDKWQRFLKQAAKID